MNTDFISLASSIPGMRPGMLETISCGYSALMEASLDMDYQYLISHIIDNIHKQLIREGTNLDNSVAFSDRLHDKKCLETTVWCPTRHANSPLHVIICFDRDIKAMPNGIFDANYMVRGKTFSTRDIRKQWNNTSVNGFYGSTRSSGPLLVVFYPDSMDDIDSWVDGEISDEEYAELDNKVNTMDENDPAYEPTCMALWNWVYVNAVFGYSWNFRTILAHELAHYLQKCAKSQSHQMAGSPKNVKYGSRAEERSAYFHQFVLGAILNTYSDIVNGEPVMPIAQSIEFDIRHLCESNHIDCDDDLMPRIIGLLREIKHAVGRLKEKHVNIAQPSNANFLKILKLCYT